MRVLVNENVSASVIRFLRGKGHDVLSVKESLPGASDATVLQKAQAENRLVFTHDKDFGELAVRYNLPSESGVILFRLSGQDPETDNRRMAEVLESRTDWAGYFSVVDDFRIRMRPLPKTFRV